MQQKKRAFARLERGIVKRAAAQVALAAASTVLAAGSARAAEAGCEAVNGGAMKVELADESRATRDVALKAGDRLTFNFEATQGPFGALTLRTGSGAPRAVLVGPSGTSAAFVAPRSGAYRFEFTKEGAEPAAFAVACAPTDRTARAKPASAGRYSVNLLGARLNEAEDFAAAELDGVILEPKPAAASEGNRGAQGSSANPKDAKAQGLTGVDMRMQWRGERYTAAGPDGLEIDNSASGVEAAINYKLLPQIMVGALAQVDQPGETLVATAHSFSDQGWMAGPVTNIKLGSGLVLDARAAWGLAESATDELSRASAIPRRLVSARLANTQAFGPWRLTPSVSVNHVSEAATTPVPTAPPVSATPYTGSFGRVDAGPEVAYRIDLGKSGFVEPRAAVGTFWDFDTLSRLTPGAGHGDMRLKAEAGVTVGVTGGAKLQAGGTVEEGEAGAANIWSGRLQLSVPMQ